MALGHCFCRLITRMTHLCGPTTSALLEVQNAQEPPLKLGHVWERRGVEEESGWSGVDLRVPSHLAMTRAVVIALCRTSFGCHVEPSKCYELHFFLFFSRAAAVRR